MSDSGARTSPPNMRRVERSALTALLPVVVLFPVFLMAMVVFWLPLRFVFGIPYWIVPVAWVLAAALLFVPSVQVVVLARFLGTRPPTPDELTVITPIWRDLAVKANLPQYRYVVRVIDSDELNAFAWRSYLGPLYGSDDVPSYAAPARAANLAGLAPAYIHVGGLDGFVDENIAYAGRLVAAGVPVELHVLPLVPHGFDMVAPEAAVSVRATALSDAALARVLS